MELRSFLDSFPASPRRDDASLLARSFAALSRFADAVRILQDLRASPRLGDEASLELARVFSRYGKHESAARILKGAIERQPASRRRSELELARELAAGGELGPALEVLRGSPAAAPDSPLADQASYLLAFVLLQKHEFPPAAAECERFLERFASSPRRTEVLELRAEALFFAGEYARATTAYREHLAALKLLEPLAKIDSPLQVEALYRLSWCYHKMEDAAGTVRAYEAFTRAAPESDLAAELAYLAAKAHLRQGNAARAGELFGLIRTRFPESREAELALLGRAECLGEEEDFEGAKREFEEFLRLYPSSAAAYRAHFGLGWAEEHLGRLPAAKEHYRRVPGATTTPTAARAQFQLGQCYAAEKDYARAIVELLQVPARYTYEEWSAKALLQAAGCFEALGDLPQARKHYEEVMAKFSGRGEADLARERLGRLEP